MSVHSSRFPSCTALIQLQLWKLVWLLSFDLLQPSDQVICVLTLLRSTPSTSVTEIICFAFAVPDTPFHLLLWLLLCNIHSYEWVAIIPLPHYSCLLLLFMMIETHILLFHQLLPSRPPTFLLPTREIIHLNQGRLIQGYVQWWTSSKAGTAKRKERERGYRGEQMDLDTFARCLPRLPCSCSVRSNGGLGLTL